MEIIGPNRVALAVRGSEFSGVMFRPRRPRAAGCALRESYAGGGSKGAPTDMAAAASTISFQTQRGIRSRECANEHGDPNEHAEGAAKNAATLSDAPRAS